MANQLSLAKDFFYQRNYQKAQEIFIKENENYYAGLCALLLKNKKLAQTLWKKDAKKDPACQFGLCILKYIELKSDTIPSFFQTRAFLEIYINLFLENNLIEYCENLISCNDALFKGNPESYKFIARALYSNAYFDLAITFCKKSLDICYSDPEAMLIIAQCYYLLNKKEIAKLYIDKLTNIVKDYYPAILFNKILSEE